MLQSKILKHILGTTAILLLLPVVMLFSFKNKLEKYADFWQQLGITKKDGSEKIAQSFMIGYLQYYGVKNLKNIAAGDRKAITSDLLNYTKKYVRTTEFIKAYETRRQQVKPREVTKKPRTEEQIRDKLVSDTKKGMANLEKSLKTATGDLLKILQDSYDTQKKQLEEYQKADNEQVKMIAQNEQTTYTNEVRRFEEKMKTWERDYPADSYVYVKRRLQEVLDATEGIDYNAALVERNNKKYFVKPEYERKSSNWKMGFRAGKEVTETVRTFVAAWIGE